MRDGPTPQQLIAIALDTWRKGGREEGRENAEMVAKALGIAFRDMLLHKAALARELAGLRALLVTDEANADLNYHLASAIRAGRFDDDVSLRAHLERVTRDKLAIDKPEAPP